NPQEIRACSIESIRSYEFPVFVASRDGKVNRRWVSVSDRVNVRAWFKSGLQLRGGWGRRPKGNAPRSEASALGLAGCCPLDPSHPTIVTCEVGKEGHHTPMTLGANHVSRAPDRGVTLNAD